MIIPKIKNSKNPKKKIDVCQKVSFSSCASVSNSSVTKKSNADSPKDKTISIAHSEILRNKVAPKNSTYEK